jgi:mono/diheme cytochrome c family protein
MRRLVAVTCMVVTAAGAGVSAVAIGVGSSPSSRSGAAETAVGSATKGKAVFASSCTGCHAGMGSRGGVGPRLKGMGLKAAVIERKIKKGGGMMPSGLVTGAKLKDVVAYVVSIQKK